MKTQKNPYEAPVALIEEHVGMIILESSSDNKPIDEDQGEWDPQF